MTLIGIVVVASLPQLTAPAAAEFQAADLYLPLNAFPLRARTAGGTVSLSWPLRPPAGTRASFALFRDTQDQAVCTPQGNGATECDFDGTQVAATAGSASAITDRPPPGRWTYRVALSATPFGPQAPSDYVLVSTPVTVLVRPVSGSH